MRWGLPVLVRSFYHVWGDSQGTPGPLLETQRFYIGNGSSGGRDGSYIFYNFCDCDSERGN